MLADAGASAVLAPAPDAVMLADACAPAVLSGAPLAVCSQMLVPAVLAGAPEGARALRRGCGRAARRCRAWAPRTQAWV
jgi:hypothetical protein